MNIRTLTKLEFQNYLGLNEIRYAKDPGVKKNRGLIFGTIIFLMVVFAGYMTGQSIGLSKLGLTGYIPIIYFALAFMVNLCMGIYKAKSAIYRERDIDQMSAFPVNGVSIVASRVFRMYVDNLILALIIIIPSMIVYTVNIGSGVSGYIFIIPLCLVLPILPSAISAWVGILFAAIIARNRHKVLTEVLLALVLVIGSFVISGVISSKAGMGTPGAFAHKNEINEQISAEITKMLSEKMEALEEAFPPMKLMENIMNNANVAGLLIYAAISLAVFAITVFFIGSRFFSISKRLFNTRIHRQYSMEGLKKKSIMTALLKKEAARYFSSGIYVSNTIIGFVLAIVFAVALGFIDIETMISNAGEIPIKLNADAGIGYILAITFSMMSISASSISMEGKNWWIMRTLPLEAKEILGAKLLFNLIVAAPFYTLSEIILLFTVNAGVMERLWLIIIPLMVLLYSVLLGLFCNLKLPKFNWEKESDVVKQSAATGLSLLGGLVIIIFFLGAVVVPAAYTNLFNLGITAILGALCILFYRKIVKTDLAGLN